VSCAPQAWASASVFLLLQSCLGLRISAGRRQLTFADPVLPAFLDWVQIRGLRVGSAEVDLSIERHPHDVGVTVLRRIGDVRVIVSK
jgi:glycogen debranching enzyme